MPARLPTPEPEPEPEYPDDAHQSDEGYQSQEESCIKCHDFSAIDAHAALFPRHTVTSVQKLAHDLTAPFASETEKARAQDEFSARYEGFLRTGEDIGQVIKEKYPNP